MEQDQVTSAIEAILFSADKPVTLDRLKEVLGEVAPHDEELKIHLEAIKDRYLKTTHGFELREAQGGYHFVTKACNGDWVRKFLQTRPFRLGRSALETMAIIAYRQPITRAEIDQVRGIDSSHLLRTLIERGLVKMAGKAEVPGRPVQYGTTPKFLEVMGLSNLSELPPLSELEQLQGNTEDPAKLLEDNLQRFIDEKLEGEVGGVVGELDETLNSIDTMIQSANQGTKEVQASPLHAEVAQENEAALQGFLDHMKAKRRQKTSVTYEDLTAGAPIPPLETPATTETVN